MDADRIAFVFDGAGVEGYDLTDERDVEALLLDTFPGELPPARFALRQIVANQILGDDPAEVWSTVQRLISAGLDRDDIFRQLALTLAPQLIAVIDGEPFDSDSHVAALARLPLPSDAEIEAALLAVVAAEPGLAADDLDAAAAEMLGWPADDELIQRALGEVIDHLVTAGDLTFAPGDRVVAVEALTAGIVLTHRVDERERADGVLDGSFDLAAFGHRGEDLRLLDGRSVTAFVDRRRLLWFGPDGWLDHIPAGTVVAVSVSSDGVVALDPLAADPVVDDALARRLRHWYDVAIEEPWLPVGGLELVVALLVDDPTTFAAPQAPLAGLAAATGLERRGNEVAHDVTVWHNDVRTSRLWRSVDAFEVSHDGLAVTRALDVADLVGEVPGAEVALEVDLDRPVDDDMVREVLDDLRDDDVRDALIDELLDRGPGDLTDRNARFVAALVAAAQRSADRATAHYLAALHHERSGAPQQAEQQLRLAHAADPGNPTVVDRLGWYASVRGDAATALRLFRQLEPTASTSHDIAEFEALTGTRRNLGRNEPCWCGSGRKYKQCHLGAAELPALPERVGWLCRKAVGFVERRGPVATDDIAVVLEAITDGLDGDDRAAAARDPLVMDLVLTECGWFEEFLDDVGELLPGDELILARAWTLVERTVYEVIDVRPGEEIELRDLRTGDELTASERTFSGHVQAGELVCARAVPAGADHQLIGGIFPVRAGDEERLIDILDDGGAEEIASWVAAGRRPPELRTSEGEPLVECQLVIDVGDAAALVSFLDARYERGDDADRPVWREMSDLNDNERIRRATLSADGARLHVETSSERRAERVLDSVSEAFPAAAVVDDRRVPLDVQMIRQRAKELGPSGEVPDSAEVRAAKEQIRDMFEQRWCDESVPALGGLTPREAAADPTRRESLVRLLAGFDRTPAGEFGMRPARLRELLGL